MAPVIIAKIGVRQLSVPAKELSIPSSARQNKKAGNKLPSVPEMKTKKSLLRGIYLIFFTVIGNNIKPAKTILKEAIW